MCRKYRGDVVYAVGADDGWVQLHESHGELHGALGWISVKKHPNKLPHGVSPIDIDSSQDVGGFMFNLARVARAAGMHGSASVLDGLDKDGFTPLKENEEEAEVYLEPMIRNGKNTHISISVSLYYILSLLLYVFLGLYSSSYYSTLLLSLYISLSYTLYSYSLT